MGYYFYYIATEKTDINVLTHQLASSLKSVHNAYSVECFTEGETSFDLYHNDLIVTQIDCKSEDNSFREVIEYLQEQLISESPNKGLVLSVLRDAKDVFMMQALYAHACGTWEKWFDLFRPICNWFNANVPGLFYAENDGFYLSDKLVLPSKKYED